MEIGVCWAGGRLVLGKVGFGPASRNRVPPATLFDEVQRTMESVEVVEKIQCSDLRCILDEQ